MKYPWDLSKHEFFIVLCCFISAFLVTFNSTMISAVSDQFQEVWGLDYSYALFFKQTIAIAMIVFSLFCVAFSDKYGKKRSMMIGLIIVIISSTMCIFTRSFEAIITARMFTGLGISMISVSSLSILTDVSKEDHLLETVATLSSASCIGAIIAPMLGLIWADLFGVMTVFLMPIPICIFCLFVFRNIDNTISKPDMRMDPILHILFIAGMALILRSLFNTQLEHRLFIVVTGIILMICFIIMNHRSENKIFDAKIFRIKTFTTCLIIGVLFSFISYAIDDIVNGYLVFVDGNVVILGITISLAAIAAFASGLKPFIQAIFSPIVAKWNKKHPSVNLSVFGFLILAIPIVSLFIILVMTDLYNLAILSVLLIIVMAIGATLFTPTNKKTMMSCVPKEDRNFASSMTMIVSPVSKVLGVIFLLNLLHGNTTRETYSAAGLTLAGIITAAFVIGVIIITVMAVRKKRTA